MHATATVFCSFQIFCSTVEHRISKIESAERKKKKIVREGQKTIKGSTTHYNDLLPH